MEQPNWFLKNNASLKVIFCVLFIGFLFNNAAAGNTIPLVKGGRSNYSIIISPGDRAGERRAASLLQDYVFKISAYLYWQPIGECRRRPESLSYFNSLKFAYIKVNQKA